MKHLIETTNPSGLAITEYDRIILNSATNDVIVGGGYKANVLMVSMSGYQLIDGYNFEYEGPEVYEGEEYFKYVFAYAGAYILAPTRNITKVTFPFDGYHFVQGTDIVPISQIGIDSLYGFTSVPENKILMKPRTDIGTHNNGKDYVDLGLTSGTLWAKYNVGATSETDYGSYFQWGDTVDKRDADCSWSNYKYCNGSDTTLTKYCTNSEYGTVDNKLTLDLEDDAARANMGGDWKMPSLALMEELACETDREEIINYNSTGVNVFKFTSKANGKSIIFPASGNRDGSSNNNKDNNTYIWSSLANAWDPRLAFRMDYYAGINDRDNFINRYRGCVVRGVL